jgi:hypothetical protein
MPSLARHDQPDGSPRLSQPHGGIPPRLYLRGSPAQHPSVRVRTRIDEPAPPIRQCRMAGARGFLDALGFGITLHDHLGEACVQSPDEVIEGIAVGAAAWIVIASR